MRVDPLHHLAEHLDQAPVRVEREPCVVGPRGKPFGGLVVQPEVEDRVHHPGHRDGRARTHRDEQRIVARAEPLAGPLLEPAHVLVDLLLEPVGQLAAGSHGGAARVGRDREPGRDRHAHQRHLGEADALAAEEIAAAGDWLLEVVDVAIRHGPGIYPGPRRRRARYSASQASARRPNQNGVKSP